MKKAVITTLSCLFLAFSMVAPAYARELVAGGQAVGIEINTEGVMVAGVGEVQTEEGSCCPAEEAGLKEGDLIKEINGKKLNGAVELIDLVCEADGEPVRLKVLRDNQIMRFNLQPAKTAEEQWRLGMWLRDSITGLGTVTFYDVETGIYGALGHGISDTATGKVLPIQEGKISDTQIAGVTKGQAGVPGELNGCSDAGKTIGTVEKNTPQGIYGRASIPNGGKHYMTGEMEVGHATILSTVEGREPREYSVEINKVYNEADGERVMLTVTDPRLCQVTGGIVQGMSGSPIIQNGKLVGAVTHVFVNDPRKGYGISIQDMLKTAGIVSDAA